MDLNFFKKIKILDGGMGQELLARGLISRGTLWSASALMEEKNHKLLIDTHLSFINAGADVITTNTFSSRYPTSNPAITSVKRSPAKSPICFSSSKES